MPYILKHLGIKLGNSHENILQDGGYVSKGHFGGVYHCVAFPGA